ncbi:ABC transporter ATPase component [Providencia rustigianii]|nr:ABC transporter ATPase component [Providencia rustigianii]
MDISTLKKQKAQTVSLKSEQTSKVATSEKETKSKEAPKRTNKLSYNLLRELELLPAKLEQLEGDIEALQAQIGDADFFNQPHDVTEKALSTLAAKEQELEQAFDRWQELELLKNS